MVTIAGLWLPILLSAVAVFMVSGLLHMVLNFHKNDYKKVRNEDGILEAMRKEGVDQGMYMFPHGEGASAMKDPAWIEKCRKGPVGILTVMPSGVPNMGKSLMLWFCYCVLVSIFVAYLTSRTVATGSHYLMVFRVAGAVAFMAYGVGNIVDSIWRAQPWGVTFRHVFDGLIYALLTAGVFGWLWVR